MHRRKVSFIILIFLCSLFFVFIVYQPGNAQYDIVPYIHVNSGDSIGQTFTSLHRGLNKIGLTLSSDEDAIGSLQLNLFDNNTQKKLVLTKEYSINIGSPSFIELQFETQKDSYLRDYYLELTWTGSGSLLFQTSAPESYDQGSLYKDSSPVMAQLSFNLVYDRLQLCLGLGAVVLKWLWQLFLTILILGLPGWAVMLCLWSGWKNLDFFVKLILAFGLSYALYPLLFLLADMVSFYPGKSFFVWGVLGFSALIILLNYLPDIKQKISKGSKLFDDFLFGPDAWRGLVFVLILGVIFFMKLWAIRTLDTPMWGDSYQHTMITQLMMENGGLFDSWQPYVPFETLTVHFGFHSISTVFAWISNLNASQSVLWIGQISNALAAFALYPIAVKIAGNKKWAGVIAVLFAGLVLKYPNYYVNWGRYAQLSGQIPFPLIGFLLIEALFSENRKTKILFVVSIFLAGMALCYYRMPFFLILWLPLIIGEMVAWLKLRDNKVSNLLLNSGIILGGMIVLLFGLFIRISGGTLAESVGAAQNLSFSDAFAALRTNLISTKIHYPEILLYLTIFSALVSLIKKEWRVSLVFLGMLLLHTLRLGSIINIPFSSYMGNLSIQIMSYIGISIILAYIFSIVAQALDKANPIITPVLLLVLTLIFSMDAKNVTDKTHEMVTRADLRAFQWINENTEIDDVFLVNGFTIYNNSSGVGSDAGWWISLLTNRNNTMPPQYALLNEKPEMEDYPEWVVKVINYFEKNTPASDEGLAALCEWGVNYIYIGQKQGSVNDPTPLLNWQEWEETAGLSVIYAEDHVRIFQVNPTSCQADG